MSLEAESVKIARTILEEIFRKYVENLTAIIEDIPSKNIFNFYKINLISNLRSQNLYFLLLLLFFS